MEGLTLVDTRHEENALFMAEGWALATGEPAVAAVTAGPGLANAVPAMAEAQAAGVPVVVIAGRTSLAQRGQGAVQDLDQLGVTASITKWRGECLQTERIPEYVATAVHQARSGMPGVAYLEIPQDVLGVSGLPVERPWPTGFPEDPRSQPVNSDVDRAVDLLQNASHPVVLAGSGAFFSRAGDALTTFVERTGIPVTTTSAARGLVDDDHPVCLGSLVHGGIALASSDVALVLGSRFNANLVYGGPPLFSPGQQLIQVDIRAENLGGPRRPEIGLVGDVSAALLAMTEAWTKPADAFAPWTNLFIGSAMGTLGIGLPFGIAARAARPGEPVFVFTGDGAFGLSAIELDTAARHRLPVVVVVVNNGGWGDVRHEQRMFYGEEADQGAILSNMRYDLLAEAVGGHAERVTEQAELRPALERAMKATDQGYPAVVDCVTDPEVMSDLMRNLGGLNLM